MHRVLPPLVLLIAGAGALSGCGRLDTYNRPYTWHPTGANAANIAAQVVNPDDLIVGHGSNRPGASIVVPGLQQVDSGQAPAAAAAGASGAGAGAGASTGAGGGAS